MIKTENNQEQFKCSDFLINKFTKLSEEELYSLKSKVLSYHYIVDDETIWLIFSLESQKLDVITLEPFIAYRDSNFLLITPLTGTETIEEIKYSLYNVDKKWFEIVMSDDKSALFNALYEREFSLLLLETEELFKVINDYNFLDASQSLDYSHKEKDVHKKVIAELRIVFPLLLEHYESTGELPVSEKEFNEMFFKVDMKYCLMNMEMNSNFQPQYSFWVKPREVMWKVDYDFVINYFVALVDEGRRLWLYYDFFKKTPLDLFKVKVDSDNILNAPSYFYSNRMLNNFLKKLKNSETLEEVVKKKSETVKSFSEIVKDES